MMPPSFFLNELIDNGKIKAGLKNLVFKIVANKTRFQIYSRHFMESEYHLFTPAAFESDAEARRFLIEEAGRERR
jgi:hypothetical protein